MTSWPVTLSEEKQRELDAKLECCRVQSEATKDLAHAVRALEILYEYGQCPAWFVEAAHELKAKIKDK
jgi:hypothetical protein